MRKFWFLSISLALAATDIAIAEGASLPELCRIAHHMNISGAYRWQREDGFIDGIPAKTLSRVPEFSAITRHWLFKKLITRGNRAGLYPIFLITNDTDPDTQFTEVYQTLQSYFRNGLDMLASDISARDTQGRIAVRPATLQQRLRVKLNASLKEKLLAFRQTNPLLYISLYVTSVKATSYAVLPESALSMSVMDPKQPHVLYRAYMLPVVLHLGQGGLSKLFYNRAHPHHNHSFTRLLSLVLSYTLNPEQALELVFLHQYYRDSAHFADMKALVKHVFDGDLDPLDDPTSFFTQLVQVASSVSENEAKVIFEALGFSQIQGFIDDVLMLE